jgi:hypothetical protein
VDALLGSGPVWSYCFVIGTIAYVAADLVSRHANPASLVQEIVIWGLLTAFAASTMAGLIFLAEAISKATTDSLLGALLFFSISLTALNAIDATNAAIGEIGSSQASGAKRIFRFFENRYLQGGDRESVSFKGRKHVGVMLSELLILATALILATGFFTGWIYDWFN